MYYYHGLFSDSDSGRHVAGGASVFRRSHAAVIDLTGVPDSSGRRLGLRHPYIRHAASTHQRSSGTSTQGQV